MFIATISINDKKFHFQNDDKKFLEKFVKSILDIIILLNTEHTKLEDKRFAAREKFKKTLPNHSSKPKKKVIVDEEAVKELKKYSALLSSQTDMENIKFYSEKVKHYSSICERTIDTTDRAPQIERQRKLEEYDRESFEKMSEAEKTIFKRGRLKFFNNGIVEYNLSNVEDLLPFLGRLP